MSPLPDIPEHKGVPDTDAIRADLRNYAPDDCPWDLIDEALAEVDRLRARVKELELAATQSKGGSPDGP